MASWSTPTTHTAGDTLAVSDWNVVANNETFLYQAPYARYYNSVATSLPGTTLTQVTLGGTSFSGYGFSVSSNNAIAPLTGIYWTSYAVYCLGNTSAFQLSQVQQNGAPVANGDIASGVSVAGGLSTGSTIVKATAADTIGLYGEQGTGGALNTSATATGTFLSLAFVGST